MKLFWQYLGQRRGVLLAYALFAGLFCASFALYQVPVGAAAYPSALCAGMGLTMLFLDFLRVRRKHQALLRLQTIETGLAEHFPKAGGMIERDYQAVICAQCDARRRLETEAAARQSDMADYYAAWTHQIKTPIAAMRLRLQGEDTPLSRRLSGDLFRVEQYVEMAMAYQRLGGPSDYVIREYALDPIVRQAVRKFAGEFIDRKIRLLYEPCGASVLTDEKWLSFVIEQVLSNALKYTPQGSVIVRMEAPKTLVVRDSGIGVAPEDLPRIFEKGFTGRNGRADKRASGIGLYLCRRVCENLGHTICARSRPGEGTEIRIGLEREARGVE